MMNSKGIFFTFMAFLLIGTLMVLSSSLSQAGLKKERNIVQEKAFDEADSLFNNIREEIAVTNEGYASNVYGRFMPFKGFEAGKNWLKLEQDLPIEGSYLADAYNALNLFAVFAKATSSKGVEVEAVNVAKSSDWSTSPGAEQFPAISYIALPQCMLFTAEKDNDLGDNSVDDALTFYAGKAATDGCEKDFNLLEAESFRINVHVQTIYYPISCQGFFDNNPTL